MTIEVIKAEDLAQVIEQSVKAIIVEVMRQMREGAYYEPKDIMTSDELLEYLNHNGIKLSKQTIFDRTHKGTIPYTKAGNKLLFKREEIDQWLDDYCNRGRANKADKSAAVKAMAESAAEIIKRNK